MGLFSSIAKKAKRKLEERQKEVAAISQVVAELNNDQLMYIINNNPKGFYITLLAHFQPRVKKKNWKRQ